MVRRRSRVLFLAAGAAIAAVTVVTQRDDAPPNQLAGKPLVNEAAAATVDTEETEPGGGPVIPTPLVGDAALAGALDPTAIEKVEGRYEAPLADGRRAVLTLDPSFQDAAAAILRESRAPRGAIVVLDADGSVLALAGRRAANPGGSVEGTPDAHLAVSVWAPAASIFKIVTASALVDAGVKGDTRVCFHGGVRSVMESNLTDSKLDRRCETLTYGVAHSQNAIIAKLVHQTLVPEDLTKAATALGVVGETPPWALGGPAGTLTVPAEKGVDLGKTAAGFIGSEMSPVGAALLASAIGNHGKVATPRIVAEVIDGEHTVPVGAAPARQAIAESTADQVARMMASTCTGGSAAKSFRAWKGARVSGKTGTLATDKPYVEYSWFVGFVDTDQGAVAIAVVLGNAEDWWMKAHTAARRVLDRALKPKS
jgi:cell division protein FtsI/penicillin-binding protein 2